MILGITGISGSGKHTAAAFFQQKNWVVFDVDAIAHYLYRPYTHVWKAITQRFGESILNRDDVINRAKLAQIVFNETDPAGSERALTDMNAIVHPAIKRALKEKIHSHFQRQSNIVIVAALWKEIDLLKLCDKVLLVAADPETARKRIQSRDGISENHYRFRVLHQSVPDRSDFTVRNDGTLSEFYRTLAGLPLNG